MFAVFDTVFHQTIPDEAALYPLPTDLARRHKIRRYGFHGISHRYMALRYSEVTRRSPVAAIRRGKSIDTSMGFTLEGLMMGTRSGDIDPAIVTYLMRKENLDTDGADKFLNKNCGFLGVSGVSADKRQLHKHLSDPHVNLALSMFAYRVRKYVGAYLAVLGGATDQIITIGYRHSSGTLRAGLPPPCKVRVAAVSPTTKPRHSPPAPMKHRLRESRP